jgi:N-carbamoylputrescine amidase
MRTVSLAAAQFSCSWDREANIAKADRLVRQAAGEGAQVVLLPELFETPYFCAVQNSSFYDLAQPSMGTSHRGAFPPSRRRARRRDPGVRL